ncbi:MAG: 4-alpha-glucanotransferase, partial [Firmicutes bacterium]|nr:4-alpha-glucanotransferase [Candidatus Scatoplasma merdavium]
MIKRASGVLLPIFSLPGKYGIGTFGKEAYNFADFLLETKQKYWQFLPLNPTSYGDSPYQSFSAFAINPYFIDLEMLIEKGYLKEEDCVELAEPYSRKIDYGKEYYCRFKILYKAYENAKGELAEEVEKFRKKNRFWIEDYAQFMVLKNLHNGKGWYDWEEEYRLKNTKAMNKLKKEHKDEIDFYVHLQFFAFVQYAKLK